MKELLFSKAPLMGLPVVLVDCHPGVNAWARENSPRVHLMSDKLELVSGSDKLTFVGHLFGN
jgi:hypothetical protein